MSEQEIDIPKPKLQHRKEGSACVLCELPWEGKKPTDCPGYPIAHAVKMAIWNGKLDYVDGHWVYPGMKPWSFNRRRQRTLIGTYQGVQLYADISSERGTWILETTP